MSEVALNEEDRVFIRDLLRERRDAGEVSPLLALNVDLNGDGIADAFGLDEDGEVVVFHGVALEDTSYEATDPGDDIPEVEEE